MAETLIATTVETPESTPWSVRDVWIAIELMVLINLGMFFIVSLWDKSELFVNVAFLIGEFLYLLPVVLFFALRKISGTALGLRPFNRNFMVSGCGWLLGVYFIIILHNGLLAVLGLNTQGLEMLRIFSALKSPYWVLFTGIVVAPFVEEIFFRGFVFAGMRQAWGWKKAAFASSAVFAVFHLDPVALIPTFLLGFVFSYLYQQSKSIWPGVILHFLVNSFGLCAALTLAKFVNV